jgi:hypothetical protein
MERKLYISRHLLKRYSERFCNDSDLELSLDTPLFSRTFKQKKRIREVYAEIDSRFQESKETKSYMNNSNALLYLYETYGYDKKFSFFHHDNMLVVACSHDDIDGTYKGITCYDIRQSKLFKNVQSQHNFKKFKK